MMTPAKVDRCRLLLAEDNWHEARFGSALDWAQAVRPVRHRPVGEAPHQPRQRSETSGVATVGTTFFAGVRSCLTTPARAFQMLQCASLVCVRL